MANTEGAPAHELWNADAVVQYRKVRHQRVTSLPPFALTRGRPYFTGLGSRNANAATAAALEPFDESP